MENDRGGVYLLIAAAIESCTFISAKTTVESERNVPMRTNIINCGHIEVSGSSRKFGGLIVSSRKEDGASADAGAEAVDEDAPNIKNNDATIGGMDRKMLRNLLIHLPVYDIQRTLACIKKTYGKLLTVLSQK